MSTEPRRFRRKPVVIEAMRVEDAALAVWAGQAVTLYPEGRRGPIAVVHTLEGLMYVGPGDWIIKGVAGEFYSCNPDIFEATYEPA